MEKYDLLGLRLIITIVILIVVTWFFTVGLLGKTTALDMHATLMHTDPTRSKLDKVWIRTLTKTSGDNETLSTCGRTCFRRRTFVDSIYYLNYQIKRFLFSLQKGTNPR